MLMACVGVKQQETTEKFLESVRSFLQWVNFKRVLNHHIYGMTLFMNAFRMYILECVVMVIRRISMARQELY